MLTLVIPARTAATSPSSATPDDPCRTRGPAPGVDLRDQPRSSRAVRSVIACELPTATARASTPVSRAKASASRGLVRAPGAWTPSLPPISPSSASTLAPACAALRDRAGALAVLVVAEPRAVEHHRGEAEPEGLVDERLADRMVEVEHHRHRCPLGQHPGRRGDRRERAVEGDGVLADLEHHGQAGLLGGRGERLRVLEVDDVEGRHPRPSCRASSRTVWSVVSIGAPPVVAWRVRGRPRAAAGRRLLRGGGRPGCSTAAADQPRRS